MAALHAAGLGLGLGVVSGMPLGVINISIVDAATAGRRRFAGGLGLGGAGADTIHALLAFAGIGRVVTADPRLVRGLAIAAAIAIVGYAAAAWRHGRRAVDPRIHPDGVGRMVRGAVTGFVLTAPNPAALAAWVAVAAAVWPDARLDEAAVLAGGVGVGSAVWFTVLARWIGRLGRHRRVFDWIPRVALIVLIAIAIAGVVRAL